MSGIVYAIDLSFQFLVFLGALRCPRVSPHVDSGALHYLVFLPMRRVGGLPRAEPAGDTELEVHCEGSAHVVWKLRGIAVCCLQAGCPGCGSSPG